jgi:hypothetical protein
MSASAFVRQMEQRHSAGIVDLQDEIRHRTELAHPAQGGLEEGA